MARRTGRVLKSYPKIFASLAAFGVLAILFFFQKGLIVHTGIPAPIVYDSSLSVDSPQFLSTFTTLTKSSVEYGETPTILLNGDQFSPDLLTSIQHASSSIDFNTYIMSEGVFTTSVMNALTEAAKRGVQVRLLLDGFAGNVPDEQVAALRSAGGTVGVFHPILSDPFSINHRTHRRAIIIDDSVGYIGGIAIADTWLGNGLSKDEWRDTMFRLTGPMAVSLERSFNDEWFTTTGVLLRAPPITEDEKYTVPFVSIAGSAGDKNRPIDAAFINSVAAAKESIYITNPYVLPDEALRDLLEKKAKSGVDVELLVPGPKTDSPLVRWASHVYYSQMLASGIHIYEYQPGLIHAKAMVIDGRWSLVGSANIDNRSSELNDENLMGILDPILGKELIANFHTDVTHSKAITSEYWTSGSFFSRAANWFASIPLKQY